MASDTHWDVYLKVGVLTTVARMISVRVFNSSSRMLG